MLEITESARAELKRMSATGKKPDATVQRLVPGLFSRLQFVPDDTGDWDGDIVINYNDEPVFVIDEELSQTLSGWTLDMRDNINGKSLCFIRSEGENIKNEEKIYEGQGE
jgi:Fe-S cluster assembly iron-binding protein IscA